MSEVFVTESSQSDVVLQTSRVLADITIKLKDGTIADSTKAMGRPSWLILGNGSFSEAFESHLIGASVGEKLSFELIAADAFGVVEPDNIHFMEISQFPQDILIEKGKIVLFSQPSGGEIPGIVREVIGSSVKVDFNHPLAGQTILFEIEIKKIATFAAVGD